MFPRRFQSTYESDQGTLLAILLLKISSIFPHNRSLSDPGKVRVLSDRSRRIYSYFSLASASYISHPFGFTSFSPFAMVMSMKRTLLLKHLKNHGAYLLREGSRHSIYKCADRKTQIPRHAEIVDELARKICKDLEIQFVR